MGLRVAVGFLLVINSFAQNSSVLSNNSNNSNNNSNNNNSTSTIASTSRPQNGSSAAIENPSNISSVLELPTVPPPPAPPLVGNISDSELIIAVPAFEKNTTDGSPLIDVPFPPRPQIVQPSLPIAPLPIAPAPPGSIASLNGSSSPFPSSQPASHHVGVPVHPAAIPSSNVVHGGIPAGSSDISSSPWGNAGDPSDSSLDVSPQSLDFLSNQNQMLIPFGLPHGSPFGSGHPGSHPPPHHPQIHPMLAHLLLAALAEEARQGGSFGGGHPAAHPAGLHHPHHLQHMAGLHPALGLTGHGGSRLHLAHGDPGASIPLGAVVSLLRGKPAKVRVRTKSKIRFEQKGDRRSKGHLVHSGQPHQHHQHQQAQENPPKASPLVAKNTRSFDPSVAPIQTRGIAPVAPIQTRGIAPVVAQAQTRSFDI